MECWTLNRTCFARPLLEAFLSYLYNTAYVITIQTVHQPPLLLT
jgi:hypothetical protein